MKVPTNGFSANSGEAEKKVINSELWHACAGPLVCLPPVGSLIVYFPQGHSEQVAATMQKEADSIPSYPNLPSKLICMLHNITLHADGETDEVYAQMTLQPVTKYGQEALLVSDLALKQSRHPTEFFCKTLTASDTSTHGGFSVPRRAAEKIFPPLDFTMQPPAQELSATDLHDQTWTFRHIYRGQPKRHLLTTGWSIFVSSKRLVAGDAVLFIRDEKSRLLLGIRRPNRLQPPLSSSVISSDSMHIGILAAAAHASANNSPFTVFYNPRASPSDFVIPLAKYNKAMYTQVSSGMRFRMMFETEDSGVRRHMGTVTSISDLDPVKWKSSQWRNLQVGWDESTAGERPSRVSIWDIEPVITPFYICPQPFFQPKFSTLAGLQDDNSDMENMFRRNVPWLVDDFGPKGSSNSIFPGLSLVQWMSMQQQLTHPNQPGLFPPIPSSMDDPSKLLNFQSSGPPLSSQFQQNKPNSDNARQLSQVVQPNSAWSQPQQIAQSPILTPRQQLPQSQPMVLPPGTSGSTAPDQMANWNPQPAAAFQLTQQTGQDLTFRTRVDQPSSLERGPHGQQVQMQVETFRALQQSLARRVRAQPLTPQQNLSEQPLQMQDLQKLHQQQQQQQRSPQLPPEKQQAQQPNGKHFPTQNQIQCQQKAPVLANQSLIHTDGDAPTSSTWPSTSVNILRSNFPKNHCLLENTAAHLPNPAQEIYNRADELADQPAKYRVVTGVSHVDAMSSSTSYYPDTSGVLRQSFPMNNGLNGGANNGLGFGLARVTGLAPDALLSRGYGGNSSDVEPDLLSPIDSQLFRVPNVPFGGGCSNDSPVNEMVVLSGGGMWPSQTQRMRTFTKVQKRGSVGRTIDVTRYKGYGELRNDLARMFGIEGLLEDPQRTEWKLVYIDHENDILLVGDDPWEEFVSCVQSIKILSLVEVQQMSLDGDLGTHFDDNSSTSFNR